MVQAIVPATTANLGPGFDVLGLALNIYNRFTLFEREDGLVIEVSGVNAGSLATDERNLVYVAAKRLFDEISHTLQGLHIIIDIAVPLGRGLGSSSTAIVGGLIAANTLAGKPLSSQELFELAADIEGHPDNVGPAIFGGLTMCYTRGSSINAVTYKPSEAVRPILLIPSSTLETKKARAVLPEHVSLADAVFNISRSSLLISALLAGRPELLRDAMEDRLHQPYRAPLVPGMTRIIEAFSDYKDIGIALSGAGPSMVCLVARSQEERFLELVQSVLHDGGQEHSVVPVEFDLVGARSV